MKVIFSLLVFLIFSGCYNTTQPMVTIKTTLPKEKFVNISKQESKSTFALAKLIADIDRGETIFTFPAKPPTKGYLCNYTIKDGIFLQENPKKKFMNIKKMIFLRENQQSHFPRVQQQR